MSCFSKQILDYFYNIQNTGRILKPEAIGKAGSKKEGTVIEFSWRVKDDIIEDARFRTFGDVNAIAISSIITTMMIGKSVNDVLNITADDVLEHLQSSGANHLYIIDVALNALINTYENYIKKYSKANPDDKKVNVFAENLRKNLEKIENGEEFVEDNFDLSNIAVEDNDEDSYLQNLQEYNKNVEENSIEKSLTKLLQGYTSIDANGEKETVIKSQPKQSTGKRGRPRKERTPEELEALENKIVRGRGRPRRERTPEEIEAELSKPIRGRGRPKKLVEESEIVPQEKKGRGRPKKELTPEEQEALANKIIRGRGRPRKEKSQEELEKAQNQVRRGRGRPKKNQLFNLFDNEDEIDSTTEYNDYMTSNYGNLNSHFNNSYDTQSNNTFAPISNTFANYVDEDDIDNQSNNEEIKSMESAETNAIVRGRGRPKKQVQPSQPIEEKKGRGRPRKERTPEELEAELNKEKRGRGRPKKEISPEEQAKLDNKIIRGRGRPKKQIEETDELPKLNKGRGRPRKQQVEAQPIEEKKGRGRPRKERTPEELEAELNKVKRGRGRPKKEQSSIFRITKLSEENNNLDYNKDISPDEEINSTHLDDTFVEETPNYSQSAYSNQTVFGYSTNNNDSINETANAENDINAINNTEDVNSVINNTKNFDNTNNNAENTNDTTYIDTNSYLNVLSNADDVDNSSSQNKDKDNEITISNSEIKNHDNLTTEVKKGRGRPKKELTPEEQEALANKVVRGRGRPKKQQESETDEPETKKGRGRPKKEFTQDEQVAPTQSLTRNFDIETPNVTIEDSEHHYTTLENSFAPAQNKYGVGISKSTQYNVSIKKTKITKTFATDTTTNKIGVTGNDKSQENTVESAEETVQENREPLSDDVNNLLKNSSIQDALKALLGEDDK